MSENRINKALRDALKNNGEILNPDQWNRLENDLNKKRSGPAYLKWTLALLIPVLATSLYFLLADKEAVPLYQFKVSSTSEGISSKNNNPLSESGVLNQTNNLNPDAARYESGIPDADLLPKSDRMHRSTEQISNPDKSRKSPEVSIPGGLEQNPLTDEITYQNQKEPDRITGFAPERQLKWAFFRNNFMPQPEFVLSPIHSNRKVIKGKPLRKVAGILRNSFVLGFSASVSASHHVADNIENQEKVHSDSREVFNQSMKNGVAFRAELDLEYYPFKLLSLGLSSGIQYQEVHARPDFDYKHNKIPFYDVDGTIIFYLFIPDSSKPATFHLNKPNVIRTFSVPLKLNYLVNVGSRTKIQINAGMLLNFQGKPSGQFLDINTGNLRSMSEVFSKRVSVGTGAEMMYIRDLSGGFSLGLGAGIQKSRSSFNLGNGELHSRMTLYNFNIKLRYSL